MEKLMIIVIFFLGVMSVVVAIIALFKKLGSGSGEFAFMGIQISGTGAPSIFLFAGLVLMFSGRSWYHSLGKVVTLTQAVARTETEKAVVEKDQAVDAARSLKSALDRDVAATRCPAAS